MCVHVYVYISSDVGAGVLMDLASQDEVLTEKFTLMPLGKA